MKQLIRVLEWEAKRVHRLLEFFPRPHPSSQRSLRQCDQNDSVFSRDVFPLLSSPIRPLWVQPLAVLEDTLLGWHLFKKKLLIFIYLTVLGLWYSMWHCNLFFLVVACEIFNSGMGDL